MLNENLGQAFSIDRYRYLLPLAANHALILLHVVYDCLEMTKLAFAFRLNIEWRLPLIPSAITPRGTVRRRSAMNGL
jgi:hypothetical protein